MLILILNAHFDCDEFLKGYHLYYVSLKIMATNYLTKCLFENLHANCLMKCLFESYMQAM